MPQRTARNKAPKRDQIVDYLKQQGGTIRSDDGRGLTAAMAKAVGYRDVTVLNNMLARLESEGLITRDVRGRRTFAISLRGTGRSSANGRRPPLRRAASAKVVSAPRVNHSNGKASRPGQLAASVSDLAGRLGEALAALAVENEALVRRIEQLERGVSGGRAAPKRAPARRRSTAGRATRSTRGRRAA